MNMIYMILRMMSVLGAKVKDVKITVQEIWASPYSSVKSVAHNVKRIMKKTAAMFNGFYKSMKRCV